MTDEQDALIPPDPETVEAAMTAAYVAHNLTRGHDALYTAARRASMGELETAAGVNDLMQGADMLAASEDITTISAVVHALNEEAVSYTHLDVYKRQLRCRWGPGHGRPRRACPGTLRPVSYTHLDVYKRQTRRRRPECRASSLW